MRSATIGLYFALLLTREISGAATVPCELKNPCKLIDPEEFADIVGSASVKIVDQSGAELKVMFGERGLFFRSGSVKIKSQAGSPDEKCVLRILKDSLAKMHDPKWDGNPDPNQKKRYFEQRAVQHLVRVLETRCAGKSQ